VSVWNLEEQDRWNKCSDYDPRVWSVVQLGSLLLRYGYFNSYVSKLTDSGVRKISRFRYRTTYSLGIR